MAKAELDILLSKLQGRLTGSSDLYVTNRYGKTVISNYPRHKDPKKISARQRANSSSFGEAAKQAKLELADSVRLAYWQARYAEYTALAAKSLNHANAVFFGEHSAAVARQKFYSTLRGFIIAQLTNRQ